MSDPALVQARPQALAAIAIPRTSGRLRAAQIGLLINTADPASVTLGEYYLAARKLAPAQVLRVDLPVRPVLQREEFVRLREAVEAKFGPEIQALALAWTAPYRVECNAITGALTLGFDPDMCRQTCAASRPSPYFNSASIRPFSNFNLRPSMMLAARSLDQAKALVDRGVAADGALALRGRPPVLALMLTSDDAARGVRQRLYPPSGLLRTAGIDVQTRPMTQLPGAGPLLLALGGSVRVPLDPAPDWTPGGIGDHLTSFAGDLLGEHGHSTALDWIESGATASHGPVTEPCNHLQKFPHPQVLLGHYLQGATVIEAYWKSVAWPQQSLFVGEPLAAPFAPAR
ncbi:MAG TPA: TIGR03790 family protein [Rubrivivax sp.]|nr:TIGR03790 family protein [Rubrivivax sp.]